MSFEGYVQALCSKGHECGTDIHMWSDEERCSTCNAPVVWYNIVSTTNHDDEGPIELEVDKVIDVQNKDKYGNIFYTELTTYKIPGVK